MDFPGISHSHHDRRSCLFSGDTDGKSFGVFEIGYLSIESDTLAK